MQLPMPLDVLAPWGIGAVVVVVAIVVLVRGLRRSPNETAPTAPVPGFSDWTGEHVETSLAPPARAAGPVTVAEAVAVREAAPRWGAAVTYAERPAPVLAAGDPGGTHRARTSPDAPLTWPWSLVDDPADAEARPGRVEVPPVPAAAGRRAAPLRSPGVAAPAVAVDPPAAARRGVEPGGERRAADGAATGVGTSSASSRPVDPAAVTLGTGQVPSGGAGRSAGAVPGGTSPGSSAGVPASARVDPGSAGPPVGEFRPAEPGGRRGGPSQGLPGDAGAGPASGSADPAAVTGGMGQEPSGGSGEPRPAESGGTGPIVAGDGSAGPALGGDAARTGAGVAADETGGGRHEERRPGGTTGEPPASAAGAGPRVAAAVAQALAVRAASMTPADPARGEARDRLLAVLLDDPARAVGATMDLAACQDRLARLSGAVREGRGRLSEAMIRLAGAGLTAEQLARLSGLPDDEVRKLLAP